MFEYASACFQLAIVLAGAAALTAVVWLTFVSIGLGVVGARLHGAGVPRPDLDPPLAPAAKEKHPRAAAFGRFLEILVEVGNQPRRPVAGVNSGTSGCSSAAGSLSDGALRPFCRKATPPRPGSASSTAYARPPIAHPAHGRWHYWGVDWPVGRPVDPAALPCCGWTPLAFFVAITDVVALTEAAHRLDHAEIVVGVLPVGFGQDAIARRRPPRGPAPDTCRTPGARCHAPGRRGRCCRKSGFDWAGDWDCDAAVVVMMATARHRRRHHCDRRATADDCLVSLPRASYTPDGCCCLATLCPSWAPSRLNFRGIYLPAATKRLGPSPPRGSSQR